ncbi:hypothetical protein GCM10022631_01090 [Deinococcus rubellus]|uniref:DUF402 domain-containing protein n=1 Tax=Deinococcus rubellus TaxID=1889240 RepID=A0ABY5YKF1_9DEIO|nr:DUF402 domain-containing protein [Deinococcus rubellus]UWX65554.1 DUF402 domain-containing protein [Deinococcus rubellus]
MPTDAPPRTRHPDAGARAVQAKPFPIESTPAKPPKVERHDLARREHHTNTGIRAVERYHVHAAGLAVVRPFKAHPRIRAWQAHLLPALGLQVCRYEFHGPREHDYYIDLATITEAGGIWTLTDHYLDVLVWHGLRAELIDEDEFLAAVRAGYLSAAQAQAVQAQAQALLRGLAEHGHDVQAYLAARGVRLSWVDQNRADWDGTDEIGADQGWEPDRTLVGQG